MLNVYRWYRQNRRLGYAIFAVSLLWMGHGVSVLASRMPEPGEAVTRTLERRTEFRTTIRTRVVRVEATVLHRQDHVLTVYVPRTVIHVGRRLVTVHGVFHLHTKIRGGVQVAAVIPGTPVTVTVPVTVPGPTSTVTEPASTITIPPSTVFSTVTVTLPLDTGGSS